MRRPTGYAALALGVLLGLAARAVPVVLTDAQYATPVVGQVPLGPLTVKLLSALAVVALAYSGYALVLALAGSEDRRRLNDLRNVLRLAFGAAAAVALLGIVTEQWVGVLFSLGVVGFAVTFALQQPLFSLIGWAYILVKRPYTVGDRVAIEGSKGDVVAVDFLVTTLWEVDGELVSSHQPSGRTVTLPNSVVLSSHVHNYSTGRPYVWNELSVQVAYETDLAFAIETVREEADEVLGDRMAEQVADYREELAETAVEMELQDRPSVNVVQEESWVELRLRYLVENRHGTGVRNELYRRILARLNEHPDRVKFPVGRNR